MKYGHCLNTVNYCLFDNMIREENIHLLKADNRLWDFIVIGGGATGLGIAIDAASRGFKTVLLEQSDFAKVTSSRSTKLVHGGVRYLQKGDVALVWEALHERGRLYRNAPHLVKDQRFIIANYRWWEKPFYTIGLTMYDLLAGKLSLGRSLPMSKKQVIRAVPQIIQKNLRGGVVYHDGQFDDARLAINLMQTAAEQGAVAVNYAKVTALLKNGGKVSGVTVHDMIGDESFDLQGRCVVNATGIFVDSVIRMDDREKKPMVRPSQGIHLVVDRSFLGGDAAIMIPKTSDGRVLFGVPWYNRVILGTTDTPVSTFTMEPRPLEEEIEFILKTSAAYLSRPPQRKDVLCAFAGLRPLATPKRNADEKKTKEISRSHKLIASDSGLITITGGKWTTYRQMAEETVDSGIKNCGLPYRKCVTKNMKIHGFQHVADPSNRLSTYGSDGDAIQALQAENTAYREALHPNFEFTVAEVVWAVREEMAVTVDDVLARRVRALFLDARAAIEMAPKVAHVMAHELGKDAAWEKAQTAEFIALAKGYVLDEAGPGGVSKALQSAHETRALQIGTNILCRFPEMFSEQFPGRKAIIVADATTYKVAGEAVSEYLRHAGIAQENPFVFSDPDFYAEYRHVERLEKAVALTDAIPVAVGSGTINDLTKLAAHLTGRPYVCVATAASMDGYTAYGASVIYRGDKQTFTCPAPRAVLADLDIICKAPAELTAAGYADLFAKAPAGADWIIADALGVDPIDPTAWSIVQDNLHDALSNPSGARAGAVEAITPLIEGLMLSGFAMQWSRTSRPASGAEHQFSHLWDMEHHTHHGKAPSHGFKVGIATLYVTALYEQLLHHPVEQLDVAACCAQWPEWEQQEAQTKEMFSATDFLEKALTETRAKYISKQELAQQLGLLKEKWPVIKARLEKQLIPSAEVRRRLQLVGAPVEPEAIGISRDRLRSSFLRAQHLRRRLTILDIAVRTACLDRWLDLIFVSNGSNT